MTVVDVAGTLYLVLAAQGLALAVTRAGLPVLGQGAFVAVGGVGTVLLGPGHAGWPLGLAAATATAAAGVLGWVVGFGAARLRGAYLALATWALAWCVQAVLLAFPAVGGGAEGLTAATPARLESPTLGLGLTLTPGVHALVAGLLVASVLGLSVRLERGPGGLDLAALRGGPDVAAGLGVPVAARRRAVLSVTATLGGLSGAGTAVLLGLVAPADVSPVLGLELVVAVLAGAALVGERVPALAPVLGVLLVSAVPPLADALAVAVGTSADRARGALTAVLLVAVLALRVVRRPARAVAAPGPQPGSSPGSLPVPPGREPAREPPPELRELPLQPPEPRAQSQQARQQAPRPPES